MRRHGWNTSYLGFVGIIRSHTKRYSVAIIGCGRIAGGYDWNRPTDALPLTHASAYNHNSQFQLLACVDPDFGRARAFAERWNVDHALTAIRDLKAFTHQVDVISICSPTALHADHIAAVLELGPQLIFCEKPLTLDIATSRSIVDLTRQAGVLLAVNYTRRWDPKMRDLVKTLASGDLGTLRSVVATYSKGVLNNGSHMIDLLHMLLGPLRLVATGGLLVDFRLDDPTIPALLQTNSGVPVHLATGHASDYAHFEVVLTTAKGVYTIRDGGRGWRARVVEDSIDFPGYRVLGKEYDMPGGYDWAVLSAVENIRLALTCGDVLASDGTTAIAAEEMCWQIRSRAMLAETAVKN